MNRALSALSLLLIATAACAEDAPLLRCRKITDPSPRLACYDAIIATTAAGTTPRQNPDNFGFENKKLDGDLEAIDSSIVGPFEGWVANQKIRLANGQVWQISDNSKGFLGFTNPKVRVRRGAFGAFYLEIEGTNLSPRVKRAQ